MKQINEVCEKYEASEYQANKIQICFNFASKRINFLSEYGAPYFCLGWLEKI
jgi:hypothetical protein